MSNIRLQIGQASVSLDAGNPRVTIGRDDSHASLVAPDPTVSRRHCEVYTENGRAFIRDMGSSNGTWINGSPVGQQPIELSPNQQVFVGHLPLLVEWTGGGNDGATVMGAMPAELLALIQARKAEAVQQQKMPAVSAPSQVTNADTAHGTMNYRHQGSNNNGVLLIALPGDTFQNDTQIEGFLEFTAMDDETVNEISVELVEIHRKGAKKGHVWDRVLVKKGPWKTKTNDKVPMPFQLRVPSATSITSPDVRWEIRGDVDIAWAYDVECDVPINMRNVDVEKIRDAMGMLDMRIEKLESKPLGQQFNLIFQPPAQWRQQWNIDRVVVDVQYLGTNIEVDILVDKKGAFSKDRRSKSTLELSQLRSLSTTDLGHQLQAVISRMLSLE